MHHDQHPVHPLRLDIVFLRKCCALLEVCFFSFPFIQSASPLQERIQRVRTDHHSRSLVVDLIDPSALSPEIVPPLCNRKSCRPGAQNRLYVFQSSWSQSLLPGPSELSSKPFFRSKSDLHDRSSLTTFPPSSMFPSLRTLPHAWTRQQSSHFSVFGFSVFR